MEMRLSQNTKKLDAVVEGLKTIPNIQAALDSLLLTGMKKQVQPAGPKVGFSKAFRVEKGQNYPTAKDFPYNLSSLPSDPDSRRGMAERRCHRSKCLE